MPRAELPQRRRRDSSAADYEPPPIELVERAVEALREWAAQTPRCRGVTSSGIGDTTPATCSEDVTPCPQR
jgi:hypothetical protein